MWQGIARPTAVIQVPREGKRQEKHPAQKPATPMAIRRYCFSGEDIKKATAQKKRDCGFRRTAAVYTKAQARVPPQQ